MSSPATPSSPLLDHFKDLEDPRVEYWVDPYRLDIIGLTICAVLYGADTWVAIETYGRAKAAWLRQFLALPNGIASHDTIALLFAALNPDALQTCFLGWVRSVAQLSAGEVIAIDGRPSAMPTTEVGTKEPSTSSVLGRAQTGWC